MRNLRMFRPLDKNRPAMTASERRALVLKNLVASEGWQAVLEEADLFVGQYGAPLPRNENELIGYNTFSIVRDGVSQLINQIEERAATAQDPTKFDAATTGEEVIEIKQL